MSPAARELMIRSLYSHPVVDVKRATKVIDGTGNTAATLVSEMVAHHLLREITGRQRDRLFVFQPYLDLFQGSS